MNDVDLVIDRIAVVRNDETLMCIVPREIKRIAEPSGKLLHRAVRINPEDLSAVPLRQRRHEVGSVIADSNEDRAIGTDRRIAAVMLRR